MRIIRMGMKSVGLQPKVINVYPRKQRNEQAFGRRLFALTVYMALFWGTWMFSPAAAIAIWFFVMSAALIEVGVLAYVRATKEDS